MPAPPAEDDPLADVRVINLDESTQRLARITRNLHGLGLAFRRLPAVRGAAVPRSELTPFCAGFCTHGMIGCFRSHALLWQELACSPGDHAAMLVLEDDASLTRESLEVVRALVRLKRRGRLCYDLVNLGVSTFQHLSRARPRDLVTVLPSGHRVYAGGLALTTTAYVLTARGARALLAHVGTSPSYHVDVAIEAAVARAPGFVRLFVLRAPVASVGAADSTLNGAGAGPAREPGALDALVWQLQTVALAPANRYYIRAGTLYCLAVLLLAAALWRRSVAAASACLVLAALLLALTHAV